ncbi:Golgi transport complex subunit 1 [Phlyctochytrium planicorne]|nr:Golgi transport complex subunit 1 [Phlyctochytrium planicorne]
MRETCDVDKLKRAVKDEMKNKKQLLFAVASQIKLLVDTPEQNKIWHALEDNNYLRASRLWQIASVIYRNLSSEKETVSGHVQSLVEALYSVMSMEKGTPNEVFASFLEIRKNAVMETLNHCRGVDRLGGALEATISLLQSTLSQVFFLFAGESANIEKEVRHKAFFLEFISSEQKQQSQEIHHLRSSLSVLRLYSSNTEIHTIYRHLPPSLQVLTPYSLPDESIQIQIPFIRTRLSQWLRDIAEFIYSQLQKQLYPIRKGEILSELKRLVCLRLELDEAASLGKLDDLAVLPWKTACQCLGIIDFSLWKSIFHRVFLEQAINMMKSSLQPFLDHSETLEAHFGNHNVNVHSRPLKSVWNFADNFQLGTPSLSSQLLFEADLVVTAVLKFTQLIAEGKENLKPILNFVLPSKGATAIPLSLDIEEDSSHLRTEFQKCCFMALNEYAERLDVLVKSRGQKSGRALEDVLLVGRYARTLALKLREISSQFLVTSSDGFSIKRRASKRTDKEEVEQHISSLEEKYLRIYDESYSSCIQAVISLFRKTVEKQMRSDKWHYNSSISGLWENFGNRVEEASMDDALIMIPANASRFWTLALFSLCQSLNEMGDFSIEKSTRLHLLTELASTIPSIYQDIFTNVLKDTEGNEKFLIQALFDIRLLQKLADAARGSVDMTRDSSYAFSQWAHTMQEIKSKV